MYFYGKTLLFLYFLATKTFDFDYFGHFCNVELGSFSTVMGKYYLKFYGNYNSRIY